MAARRYEIYLRVVKKISRVSKANEYIIGIESGNQENNKLIQRKMLVTHGLPFNDIMLY